MDFQQSYPRMLLGQYGLCTYCGGDGADNRDHVIPFAFIGYYQDRRTIGPQVWSCSRCNSLLSDFGFNSFQERALYISNKYSLLAERYGSAWFEDELEHLAWELAQLIRRRILMKHGLRQCSDWFNSDGYLDNLEGVLYEPLLDKTHPQFKDSYYEFFRSTIDSVRQHLDYRSRSGSAWKRCAEANH